uniref:Hydrophobic seed protein domain-containing protein n=1 Tax=Oryza brachyantha TaxID=4533 RepID=J3KZG7_ORYBR
MATNQAKSSTLFISMILWALTSVNGQQLTNPCLAAPTPNTTEPPMLAPAPPPTSSPTPAPAPSSLPKCPLISADLGACVTLGLGNNPISSARQQCCSQISKLGSNTATACLCDAVKADVRVGVDVSIAPIIALILNLCGKVSTLVAVCVR